MIKLNPYPGRTSFAFALIHDADGAYSERLEPLLRDFDDLRIPITLTVFTHWAKWARNGEIWDDWRKQSDEAAWLVPHSVPLQDPDERRFYLQAKMRGHEIAMHSASETSDHREDVKAAFENFKNFVGEEPRTYVEHSSGNNLDTQIREGSVQGSIFYNADLLNKSNCWVWVDHAPATCSGQNCFDVLASHPSVFDEEAKLQFGIKKAFIRSGSISEGNGDGFLKVYTKLAIDELARARGIALVYTHLNEGWLDVNRYCLRDDIFQRLKYLTKKNGWISTASDILNRMEAMKAIRIEVEGSQVRLTNLGPGKVQDVSLCLPALIKSKTGMPEMSSHPREKFHLVGDIASGETLITKVQV